MFRKLASRLFLTHFLVAGIALMLVSLSLLLILLRGPWADQRTLAQLERSIPLVLRGRGQVLLDLPAPQLEAAVGRGKGRARSPCPRARQSSRAERRLRDASGVGVKAYGFTSPSRSWGVTGSCWRRRDRPCGRCKSGESTCCGR